VAADGSSPRRLTEIGNVIDFAVSRDGEQIAFSVPNEAGGVDLWLTDRGGNAPRPALECGVDRCQTPDWSPDGGRIAYTREAAGLSPESPPGAPRPWVFNLQAGQTAPVYEDPQVIGYDPSWSPDGRRLATVTFDGVQGGIRVLNLETGSEVFLPTYAALVGAWSPDGTQMLYPDVIETQDGYRTIITLADFSTGEFSTFLEGGTYDAAYSVPAWSPDSRYVAVGLRPEAGNPSREVWLINPATLGGPTIPTVDSDTGVTFDFYRWDPWGAALVVQRAALKGKYHPEILVYSLETGEQTVIATDAGWPQWLP
jgi:Tol biopolymer transport system component